MHAVKITNGQQRTRAGGFLTEIAYAAHQLHDWLQSAKIAKAYLVQLVKVNRRLFTSAKQKAVGAISFTLTFASKREICPRTAIFTPEKLYSPATTLVESCAITT
ncbi:hypothetical protein MJK72_04705 [Klebsiella pneumoniae]|nr:hypothetical protein MJK72_04705 [Klebsiella pneumoniae]